MNTTSANDSVPDDLHPSLLGGKISSMATPLLRDKSHTAVLIMDYQNDIVSGMAAHHPALLDRAAAVLSGARLAGLPVIYVTVCFRRAFRVSSAGIPSSGALKGPGGLPQG